jgi:hypothetical protein
MLLCISCFTPAAGGTNEDRGTAVGDDVDSVLGRVEARRGELKVCAFITCG